MVNESTKHTNYMVELLIVSKFSTHTVMYEFIKRMYT